jgi:hypothetical protein
MQDYQSSLGNAESRKNSGLCLAAEVKISLPSFSNSRPELRASTQASTATRLAAAPAALPHG